MNRLSDDMIITIFLTLPAKTLLRCRAVCRSWQSIINGSHFIDLHHDRPANKDQILSYRSPQEVTLISRRDETFVASKQLLGFPSDAHHLQPVGSVRGILCFSSETSIYFCNPSICKLRVIPNPYSHYLLHDSSKYGFGIVPRTRHFKLVRLLSRSGSSHKNSSYQVSVYTCGSNSWRRVGNRLSCSIRGSGSVWTSDGLVYWRASSLTRLDVKYSFVLAFDLDKEVFRRINLPAACSPDVDYGIFSCGRFLHMYSVTPYMTFNVWAMNDHGVSSSWTKLFTVKDSLFWISAFVFLECEERLLAVTFGGSLIGYDEMGCEVSRNLSVLRDQWWDVPVLSYKESLVWFDGSGVVEKKMFGIRVVDYSGWLMVSSIALAAFCFLMFVSQFLN